jgi:tight adherence protein C
LTSVLLCGAGFGIGLLLILRGVFPARVPLDVALGRLHDIGGNGARQKLTDQRNLGQRAALVETHQSGVTARVGQPLASHLVSLPLLPERVRSDLAVLGRSAERHMAEKVTLGLTGLLLLPAFVGVLDLGGVTLSWELPLWASLILGAAGFLVPDLGVHAEARKRRADFRHALGSFLDLVVVSLAGGAGVEGALNEASSIGQGWAFARLRRALEEARLMRIAPWGPLGRLGEELSIQELSELAATVALAGAEGAKVRATLAAKASSIRSHALADAQANAEAMSERMSLPVVVLFAGFLLFVGYPAIAHVLEGL